MDFRNSLPGRRTFLGSLSLAPFFMTRGAFAQELTETPSCTEGPFYPDKMPLDTDNDLLMINDAITPAVGEITLLSGRVLKPSGEPVRNAFVEIWQCDARGRYRHPWAPGNDRVDPYFAGFGAVNTGSAGTYLFKTLIPVPYGGRPPHIHVKLFHANRELLISQLYLRGQVSQYASQQMVIDPRSVGHNQWRADFHFVIA